MSKVIRHDPCRKCGSQDNLAIYDDGGHHCFSQGCDNHKNAKQETGGEKKITERKDTGPLTGLPLKDMPALKERGIDSASVKKYKVTVGADSGSDIEAVFPRFDDEGQHVANQVRKKNKQFRVEGDISKAGLFGQNCFPSGGKSITITEGYYDTLSAFQLTGSRYPNVGVMSATTAKKEIVRNFEYLNSFQQIVLNFDNDEPGQKAAKECSQFFEPGKVRILRLSRAKDANEYLMGGLTREYIDEWFRGPVLRPEGLVLSSELLDSIINRPSPYSVPYPWPSLNHMTYGARLSELVLLMADTGSGKSTVIKEAAYSFLMNKEIIEKGYKVGLLMLEEPVHDTGMGLLSIHDSTPYHLPDTPKSSEMLTKAYEAVLRDDRVILYDSFGSNDIDIVVAKIRHMSAMGCKYIFLDHLSIIVSDSDGDERKMLDSISTKIKTLTIELDISVFCVIHTNRQGQARGSAGPEKVSNIHLILERDKLERDEWRRNVLKITVLKNRFAPRTGPCSWLKYVPDTGRLLEMSQEEIDRYEDGGSNTGNEFEMYAK